MRRSNRRMSLKARLYSPLLGLCGIGILTWLPAAGATIPPIGFQEMTRTSGLILRATALRVSEEELDPRTPPAGEPVVPKATRSPTEKPQSVEVNPEKNVAEVSESRRDLEKPIGLPVEGRGVPFTTVVLSVVQVVKGEPTTTVTLRYPGGISRGRRLWIPGLPYFREGDSYLLFLRKDRETTGVPIVGTNQGFFRIQRDQNTGVEILLDAESDYVIGVEADRVIVRRNPEKGEARSRAAVPPPVMEHDFGGLPAPANSLQALRYWTSTEPPMSPSELIDQVRKSLGL